MSAQTSFSGINPWPTCFATGLGPDMRSVRPIPGPIYQDRERLSFSQVPIQPLSAVSNRSGPFSETPTKRTTHRSGENKSSGRNDQGSGEYCLRIENVRNGLDKRTTLMIRNIPNKYTQHMLLSEINERHKERYDFFYLPIDFKNKCNMGYAFINFIDYTSILPFYEEFSDQKWRNFNSEKVCAISYARLQGKAAMIARFQNSSLLDKDESYRPLVFSSFGRNRGKAEAFPVGKSSRKTPIDDCEARTLQREAQSLYKSSRSSFFQTVNAEPNLSHNEQLT